MSVQPCRAIISCAQRRHTLRMSSAFFTENCVRPSRQPWISQASGDFRISISSDTGTLSPLSHDSLRTAKGFPLRGVRCRQTPSGGHLEYQTNCGTSGIEAETETPESDDAVARCDPALIRQVRAGGFLERLSKTGSLLLPLPVLLAGPEPSDGADLDRPSRSPRST